MNKSLTKYVAGREAYDDQLLTEAARVALEANQVPRVIRMIVDENGSLIEISLEEFSQIVQSERS
jgi:hypothetical protein